MLRKLAVALLLVSVLFESGISTALAAPDKNGPGNTAAANSTGSIENILIKPEEESDNVLLLQYRLQDLGYFNYKITGYFGPVTQDALKDFQSTNGLSADGIAGEKTLTLMYSNDARRKTVEPIVKPKPKPTKTKRNTIKYGQLVSWTTVNRMWKIGMRCKVVDLDTGTSYYMKRCNRTYSVPHADVAPATKSDTAKLKQTYGGSWSWDRRAVIVYIGGQAIAASTNGMPHGSTGVKGNGMNLSNGTLQQVCIHFLNSRTNIHNLVDPAHQYEVKRAAGKKPGGSVPVQAEVE